MAEKYVTGQQNVTATATSLGVASITDLVVKASPTNAIPVYLGPSTVTISDGVRLDPGDTFEDDGMDNTYQLYVIAETTGAVISWIGKRR